MLLITVDTLRADRLSCLGAPPGTTPEIDALARDGVVFETAISQGCFTAPAMASLSSGQYPLTHGVLDWESSGVLGDRGGLARAFRDAGYQTVFLSGHGGLGGIAPLTDGFGTFVDHADLTASKLVGAARERIESDRTAPLFLWVHFFDVHAPYEPPLDIRRRRMGDDDLTRLEGHAPDTWTRRVLETFSIKDQKRFFTSMYDGEVESVDGAVGDLLRAFSGRAGKGGIVAFTADHGENLADHLPYFDHRNVLFDSLVRVPLIVSAPGRLAGARRVSSVVETRALGGLLLRLCGLEVDRPALDPAAADPPSAFSDSGLQEVPHKAVRTDVAKVVLRLADGSLTGYDLREDPGEERGFPAELRPDTRELARDLVQWIEETPRSPEGGSVLPEDVRRRLRELGYLGPIPPGEAGEGR